MNFDIDLRNYYYNFSVDGSISWKMDGTPHHALSAWCYVHYPFFGVYLHPQKDYDSYFLSLEFLMHWNA